LKLEPDLDPDPEKLSEHGGGAGYSSVNLNPCSVYHLLFHFY